MTIRLNIEKAFPSKQAWRDMIVNRSRSMFMYADVRSFAHFISLR